MAHLVSVRFGHLGLWVWLWRREAEGLWPVASVWGVFWWGCETIVSELLPGPPMFRAGDAGLAPPALTRLLEPLPTAASVLFFGESGTDLGVNLPRWGAIQYVKFIHSHADMGSCRFPSQKTALIFDTRPFICLNSWNHHSPIAYHRLNPTRILFCSFCVRMSGLGMQ